VNINSNTTNQNASSEHKKEPELRTPAGRETEFHFGCNATNISENTPKVKKIPLRNYANSSSNHSSELPPNLIVTILQKAGVDVSKTIGNKIVFRCPLHNDKTPSACCWPAENTFSCFSCGGRSAKQLAEELNLPWPPPELTQNNDPRLARRSSSYVSRQCAPPSLAARKGACCVTPKALERPIAGVKPAKEREYSCTPAIAQEFWRKCLDRYYDMSCELLDNQIYGFIKDRGLFDCVLNQLDLFGCLPENIDHHPKQWCKETKKFWSWYDLDCRLIVPLHDVKTGEIVNVQGRLIRYGGYKIETTFPFLGTKFFPKGGRVAKTTFANSAGVKLLKGEGNSRGAVVIGEGLTDHLALSVAHHPLPVFSAPGVAGVQHIAGDWMKGRRVLIALDCDTAGEDHVPELRRRIVAHGGYPVRIRWPEGIVDACDFLQVHGMNSLKEVLLAGAKNGGGK